MGISNKLGKRIIEFELEFEKSLGLLFPNWGPCPYRNYHPTKISCPTRFRKEREANLLIKYCSNNHSIKKCEMYKCITFLRALEKI